jgi:magnesium transporter
MLTIYAKPAAGGALAPDPGVAPHDPRAIWIDLLAPTTTEETHVEAALGIDVPTHAERAAEEDSARFYEEDGALVLTATLLGRREEGPFVSDAIMFILAKGKLVTVRQIRPRAFEIGQGRASARVGAADSGAAVLVALLTGCVERLADLIAETRASARELSVEVFGKTGEPPRLRETLQTLGRMGSMAALSEESLASLHRLASFAAQVCDRHGLSEGDLAALRRDVEELERSGVSVETHLTQLQNAALGLVAAAQNDTLKTLAVATILFAAPNLVASIFGMNFAAMTWFHAWWGPWIGFALMLAAPLGLFALARWRRWF